MQRGIPLDRSTRHAIREPSSDVPVYEEVDVLVVGGGPAGVGAALAAARSGMTTLLVERYGCLGGIWTAGLLNPYFDANEKGGIPTEIIERLQRHGGTDAARNWHEIARQIEGETTASVFNYEAMKYVLDSMALEAGVKLLLYTHAVAAIVDDNHVRGVIVENKSGRSAILATIVIDCTGDGDVAYHAGCPYELGRLSDGLLQPMTLQFKVGGFKFTQTRDDPLYDVLVKFNGPEDLAEVPFVHPAAVPVPGEPNTVAVQYTHVRGSDGTNADDLTRAVIEGRRQVQASMRIFESARQVLGDVHLIETAMQVGVRETRRIRGEYHLELDDLVNGRTFEDGICRVHYPVDVHEPDSTGHDFTYPQLDRYEIPYRCLVPKDVDQLLVAGRCISGSHEAHASYRVTGNCVAMGEAAGIAAAQAVMEKVTPREIDGGLVRTMMKKGGANL